MNSLRKLISNIILEEYEVRGYIKPTHAFHVLSAWEKIVRMFLRYQAMGVDSRKGEHFPPELQMLIKSFFPMLEIEVARYEQLTKRNAMNFIEDFVNHKFWAMKRQYSSYVPNIEILKFAYFYSRGDIEPYVLLDENWTMSIYGSLEIQKEVKHYTSEEGLQNIINSIESGRPFDISTFTTQHKEYFDPNSNLCVTLLGNVRAAFRSDVKSFATSSGRRAMNLHRLDYPGDDTNICYDLDDCEPDQTNLWNEMIVTPIEVLSVTTASLAEGKGKSVDLFTDKNPKNTIKGLKYATVEDAKASVSKIRKSKKSHAHKVQAAVAMEQRAKVTGKKAQAAVFRKYINSQKK